MPSRTSNPRPISPLIHLLTATLARLTRWTTARIRFLASFAQPMLELCSNAPSYRRPTFDPGNALPLGFKSAIPSQPRLCRKLRGPSFTLIRPDNYTTHSPFFVPQYVRRDRVVEGQSPSQQKSRLQLRPAIAQRKNRIQI